MTQFGPQDENEAEVLAMLAGTLSGQEDIAAYVTSGKMPAPETIAFFSGSLDSLMNGLAMTVKAKRFMVSGPESNPHWIEITLKNGETLICELRKK